MLMNGGSSMGTRLGAAVDAELRPDESEAAASTTHAFDGNSESSVRGADLPGASECLHGWDSVFYSKAKLAAVLASMSDAALIFDAKGHALEFNDAFAKLHRFKGVQACNASLAKLESLFDVMTVDGAPLSLEQRPAYRALHGGAGAGVELMVLRKDTGATWIGSYSFAPIRDEYGAVVGGVVTGRCVTTEKYAMEELESSHAQLRRLFASQRNATEDERKRIARELHDDLQQTLAALRLNVAAVELRARSLPNGASEAAAHALALSESAILSTRRIIAGLRPQILDDLGLRDALACRLSDFSERNAVECCLDVVGDVDTVMSAELATCLYRITQESLQNIEKHASATCIRVVLDLSDPRRAVLRVDDDGVGILAVDLLKAESFGVVGMRERVRAFAGTLRVMPGAVSGTTVEAVVPLLGGAGAFAGVP